MNKSIEFVSVFEIRENIRRIERRIEDCAKIDVEGRNFLILALNGWKSLLRVRLEAQERAPAKAISA